jgi:predicted short-subunit dehydrogenase-like oxidoreductase (DUF2520 family)
MARALQVAGISVDGPLGRGETADGADVVLLCVPDREIGAAASCLSGRPIVGHAAASTPLAVLEPREGFLLHPLVSVAHSGVRLTGAACAVDGNTPRALAVATTLAHTLGMRAFRIEEGRRPLYHAAASMASNYLVTIESAAERLARAAGIDRAALLPLVRGTVEQWAAAGSRSALTGPIVRGDEETVSRQRAAVAEAAPDLLPLWDALTEATQVLARTSRG